MQVADEIAVTLAELGVRRVYGLPGEDHMTLLHACAAAGLDYRTAFNESSAVLMAATDAQLTGVPGVAFLSLAPGVSNAVNGIMHAHLEGLPVLLVSGQHPAARQPFVVRQGFDIDQLVRPVTKWVGKLAPGTDPAMLLCQAFDVATAGRPGPVFLEVPDEVAVGPAVGRDARAVAVLREQWDTHGVARGAGPEPGEFVLHRLWARLAEARRPVLVVGGRLRAGRPDVAPETVRAFAAAFRCPVFTSSAQKGVADATNPFFAGTFLNGKLESALLGEADLVLMVNPEAFDYYNSAWSYSAPTVALTAAPLHEWLYPFDERVVADPNATLMRLLTEAPTRTSSEWTEPDVAGYRAHVRATLLPSGVDDDVLSVAAAVDAALWASPDDVCVVADAGFSKPLVALLSEPPRPGRYLASNGLSTMGFAIPAAIAAARAGAGPTLAFLGDGSLLMRASELAIARSAPGPQVFVAILDRSLSQIEIKQERRELREVGVELPELSARALGEAFGIAGRDVETPKELSEAVAGGWARGGPLLVGAHVDPGPSRELFGVLRG